MTDALIFDLDGTLVDTAPDLMAATNHVLAEAGRRPITMAEVRGFVGHGARALLTRGFSATGGPLDANDMEARFQRFLDYYSEHICAGSTLFPGLLPLLDRAVAAGFKLGVCTNKLEGLSVKLLEAIGLSPYFGAVVGPDTLGIAKPDAAPYRETLRRLGAGGRSLMIGDSETDVLTARAAGVPMVAVPFGYTPKPVAEYGPDHMVNHYDELWPVIEAVFGRT